MDEQIKLEENHVEQFYRVIRDREIKPVYQPIVSLKNGSILGYEALSRVTDSNLTLSIGELFSMAKQLGKLWELEKLCRIKALECARELPVGRTLFLNVDANVILESGFESGVTRKYLDKYNLRPENIIFEITERSDVDNNEILKQVIEHYKGQGFRIAIDDVGAGYSGLNRINSLTPQYIKIDYELVHKIDESKSQKSLVEFIIKYCKHMNIKSIAEGIETEKELKCLLHLGVDYGQGFLLGRPEEQFLPEIRDKRVLELIKKIHRKKVDNRTIGSLAQVGTIVSDDTVLFRAYSLFVTNKQLDFIIVVNRKNKFLGVVKRDLLEPNWWCQVDHNNRKITEYMTSENVLTVPYDMPKQAVLRKAMARDEDTYCPVIVLKKERIYGIVEVRNLVLDLLSDSGLA